MFKKIISALLLIFFIMPQVLGYNPSYFGELSDLEKSALTLGETKKCQLIDEEIPTIFIPGILASWYSEQGFEETKIKRWIPDPITHSYDTLFYTFRQNGYRLKDVFYEDEYNLYIQGNPKNGLYLFGYDWKKDNKLTATLLNQLIYKIQNKMLEEEGCELESVNIIAHSMGGLVARSMLEDMCVSDLEIEYFKNQIEPRNGQLRNPESVECKYPFKVNKFITISTPHRGAPRSLPVWENGDLSQVDSLLFEGGISSQFGLDFLDTESRSNRLYKIIHGYDDKIPNGIITLGQLLPDINNDRSFTEVFKYLEKDGVNINKENYPKNSFLEELNKKENINKIWDKIDKKYYSYYTDITGNKDKNNIIGFEIYSFFNDKLEKYNGKDIYDNYGNNINHEIYSIKSNIRNQDGYGGDGTVPTANLLLIPNDDTIQIKNDKFESKKIDCYIYNNGNIKENDISKMMGKVKYELCSHTQTPILLSNEIYSKISNNNINFILGNYDINLDRKLLIKNIGYLDSYNFSSLDEDKGIDNDDLMDLLFTSQYKTLFEKGTTEYKKHANLEYTKDDERYELVYGDKLEGLTRYEILSPINLIIEDEEGRKIGIDPDTGMIINEIPGAWTSGNTEGSGEPEFFLIPSSVKGLHNIKTYGIGDGEYHIEITKPLENEVEKTVIAGKARENFGEDYIVAFSGSQTGYKDISFSIPTTLEVEKEYYETLENNFELRYQIRGDYKNVDKIKYELYFENNKIKSKINDISKTLNLDFKNTGEYKLKLFLLDFDGKQIKNNESKKEIIINKIDKNQFFQEQEKQKELENKISILKEKYKLKLIKILSKLDKNKLDKLQKYLKENKEKILLKYDDKFKKIIIEFILDEIIAYS